MSDAGGVETGTGSPGGMAGGMAGTAAGAVQGDTPAADPTAADAPAADAPAAGDEAEDDDQAGPELHMALVESVTLDLPAAHPVVVVRELESPGRQLSFPVGPADGAALAHALRRVPTARPLTHDLFVDVLASFDIDLVAVRLVGRQGGTYFAEVDLQGPRQRTVLSCRPSDALGLALRGAVPVPILVDVRLFEGGGDLLPGA